MRHDEDGLFRAGAQVIQHGAAAGEDGGARVGVEGPRGGGLVWEDRVDGGEVDHGEEREEGRQGGADVAGLGGVFWGW